MCSNMIVYAYALYHTGFESQAVACVHLLSDHVVGVLFHGHVCSMCTAMGQQTGVVLHHRRPLHNHHYLRGHGQSNRRWIRLG